MTNLFGAQPMMRTIEQAVGDLGGLLASAYSERSIDAVVDRYLVGFGAQTASVRIELAEAFRENAPPSELAQRIRQRILRAE
jgi:hypothetical protein